MATTQAEGSRPLQRVMTDLPDCPHPKFQCAWGFSHRTMGPGNVDGYFWLKFINASCRLHGAIPHTRTPAIKYVRQFSNPNRNS